MRQTTAATTAAEMSEAEMDVACPWHVRGGRGHLCLDCFDQLMAAIPDELARYHALRVQAGADTEGEWQDMATKTAGKNAGKNAGETASETVDVAALVRAGIERERQRRFTALQQEHERRTNAHAAEMATLRTEIERIFPPAWRTALAITYTDADLDDVPAARLHAGHTTWHTQPWSSGLAFGTHYQADSTDGSTDGSAFDFDFYVPTEGIAPVHVRDAIIQHIAGCEIQREERTAEAHERAREQEHQRAEWEATCAAIRTEHKTCLAEIEAVRGAARATAWQWPEGVTLTLYRWEWQKARDEDGNPVMGWGWATTPIMTALDDAGREVDGRWEDLGSIYLRATRALPERVINLSYHTHLPASYTKRYTSVAELPHELTQERTVMVEGITHRVSAEVDERVYVRTAGATLTLAVDDEPLAWVREAVEVARLQQAEQTADVPF